LGLSGPDRRPLALTPRQKLGVNEPFTPVGEVNSAIPGSLVPPGVVRPSVGATLPNGLSKDFSKGFTSLDKAFDGPEGLFGRVFGLEKVSFGTSSSLVTWMLGANSEKHG
jgi:hypothetical protein